MWLIGDHVFKALLPFCLEKGVKVSRVKRFEFTVQGQHCLWPQASSLIEEETFKLNP
jgi:hypothetical protein